MIQTRIKQAISMAMDDRVQEVVNAPVEETAPVVVEEEAVVEYAPVDEAAAYVSYSETDEIQARQYASDAAADAEVVDDVCDSLEQLALSLESSLAAGGLNVRDLPMAHLAIAQQLDRVGLEHWTVSVEDFGGKMTRVEATQAALESISDKLAMLWEAIKKMVARVWAKVQEFYTHMFKSASAVQSYARTLLEQCKKLDDNAVTKSDQVKVGAKTIGQLAIGKSFDPHILGNLTNVIESMEKTEARTFGAIKKHVDGLTHYLAGHHDVRYRDILGVFDKLLDGTDGLKFTRTEEGDIHYSRSAVVPGNVRFVYSVSAAGGENVASDDPQVAMKALLQCVSSWRVQLEPVSVADVNDHMPVMKKAEIVAALEGVIKTASWIESSQGRMKEVAQDIDHVISATGKIKTIRLTGDALNQDKSLHINLHNTKDEATGKHDTMQADTYRLIGRSMANIARPQTVLHSYVLGVCRAVTVVAHRQLAAYQSAAATVAVRAETSEDKVNKTIHDAITRNGGTIAA